MYHIGIRKTDGAGYAILTGDPGRVEGIARLLDKPEPLASNREYTSWTGCLDGKRVLVISHGIGGPSTAICVEELAQCGVHTMIRVGTCGGMALNVRGGDLVVANAAIRQEGTSVEYLPIAFPAVSDFEVSGSLFEAAKDTGKAVHIGVVHCKDSFYGQHNPEDSPIHKQLQDRWQTWIRGGCLASEMETAALFIVAASKGLRSGCVLNAIWNQERDAAGLDNTAEYDMSCAVKTAIGAVRRLIKQDSDKE
jgi:uridine phosphorylase